MVYVPGMVVLMLQYLRPTEEKGWGFCVGKVVQGREVEFSNCDQHISTTHQSLCLVSNAWYLEEEFRAATAVSPVPPAPVLYRQWRQYSSSTHRSCPIQASNGLIPPGCHQATVTADAHGGGTPVKGLALQVRGDVVIRVALVLALGKGTVKDKSQNLT
jgi:hypothetical protein